MARGLDVTIWGSRGSMPSMYQDRIEFGGNTSCISVEWENGIVLFDCGSGVRAFGMGLLKNMNIGQKELHIFVSHLHLDQLLVVDF